MPQFLVKRAFLLHSTVPAIEGKTVDLEEQYGRELTTRGLVSRVEDTPPAPSVAPINLKPTKSKP